MTDETRKTINTIGDVPAWRDGWTVKAHELYCRTLADLPDQDIQEAVEGVLKTWTFMRTPPPAEFRRVAVELGKTRRAAERQDAQDREYRIGKYRDA